MASAKNDQLISSQGPHFSPCSLNPTIKIQISGRMASIGISDVVTASVYTEKTRMKKLMMMKMIIIIIIIMNKSQESTVFHGRQKLTSAMKQRPDKTLGRAQDPRANDAWLSKLTE